MILELALPLVVELFVMCTADSLLNVLQGDRSGDGDYDDEEEHGRRKEIFGRTNEKEDKEKVRQMHLIAHITTYYLLTRLN